MPIISIRDNENNRWKRNATTTTTATKKTTKQNKQRRKRTRGCQEKLGNNFKPINIWFDENDMDKFEKIRTNKEKNIYK